MPESLPLGFATVDLDRQRRQGLPEVIYAPGKQPGEIAAIAAALLDRASGPVLVTRLGPEAAAEVAAELAAAGGQRTGARGPGAYGPGDYDARARLLSWRPASPDGGRVAVVIVIAGMEGALASAVGGLVGVPVVAVPTSTGYGAALDGITALLAMMTSCAAGVCVVNIDSGFGGAMAAHRLAFSMRRRAAGPGPRGPAAVPSDAAPGPVSRP